MKYRVFPQKKSRNKPCPARSSPLFHFLGVTCAHRYSRVAAKRRILFHARRRPKRRPRLLAFFWCGARQKFFDVPPIDQRMILIRFDQSFVMEGQPICQAELVFFHAISLRSAR